MVKNLPSKPEMQVRSLSQEHALDKERAPPQYSCLGKIPWTGGAWGAVVRGVAKSWTGSRSGILSNSHEAAVWEEVSDSR